MDPYLLTDYCVANMLREYITKLSNPITNTDPYCIQCVRLLESVHKPMMTKIVVETCSCIDKYK
jgi:hypothetical protein